MRLSGATLGPDWLHEFFKFKTMNHMQEFSWKTHRSFTKVLLKKFIVIYKNKTKSKSFKKTYKSMR